MTRLICEYDESTGEYYTRKATEFDGVDIVEEEEEENDNV